MLDLKKLSVLMVQTTLLMLGAVLVLEDFGAAIEYCLPIFGILGYVSYFFYSKLY
jgi:hypothetical protein